MSERALARFYFTTGFVACASVAAQYHFGGVWFVVTLLCAIVLITAGMD